MKHVNPQTQGQEIWVFSGSITIYRRSRRSRNGPIRPTTNAFTITAAMACTQAGRLRLQQYDREHRGFQRWSGKVSASTARVVFRCGSDGRATDLGFIIHRGGEKDPGPDSACQSETQGLRSGFVRDPRRFTAIFHGAQLLAGELSKLQASGSTRLRSFCSDCGTAG